VLGELYSWWASGTWDLYTQSFRDRRLVSGSGISGISYPVGAYDSTTKKNKKISSRPATKRRTYYPPSTMVGNC